jgi:hypothetical protein
MGTSGRGKYIRVKEGEYDGKIMNSCMKWKNETCWSYSKKGGRIKENDGEIEFN